MIRMILMASVLHLALGAAAIACEGQAGDVIFEDSFPDDSGGWELTPTTAEVVPPTMHLTPMQGTTTTLNNTFNAVDGDYCATVKLPAPPADNYVGFGLDFWAKDYTNLMAFIVYTNGTVALYKMTDGVWSAIYTATESPAVKTEAGAENTVRVLAKAGKITLMLNGTVLKVVRAQVPAGNLRFGLYAEIQKTIADPPTVEVTSFQVTAGE